MNERHEYIVLGCGPAGAQVGYYLARSGRDYVVLEGGDHAGGFFDVYPRHRQLISINKRHTGCDDPEFNLRHDWNSLLSDDYSPSFPEYDQRFFPHADNLVRYLNDFVAQHRIHVAFNVRIAAVARKDGDFHLTDTQGRRYSCRYLVVATGFKPVTPDIPGIELAECYSRVSLDQSEFDNKRVLILGKGNSAFETADHLIGNAALIHLASPESVVMAWKSHYVGDLRAVNNNVLDTYQLKSQNAVIDAEVCGIRREGKLLRATFKYKHAEGEVEEIDYDRVIYCAGFRFDRGIYDESAVPALTACGKFPAITWEYESASQPRMYFAGTITHSLDYRKATSGFIHGFRYNARALARIMDAKHHDRVWPSEMLDAQPQTLTRTALGRVNRSSALWQQPGYMVDVLAIDGGGCKHYPEMPVGYARIFGDVRFERYFTVSLEYGDPIVGDPFSVERVHRENVDRSARSQFLHPVVRHFSKGKCLSEHHVLEDLEAVWTEPEHIAPLERYFDRSLKGECMAPAKEKMEREEMAEMH